MMETPGPHVQVPRGPSQTATGDTGTRNNGTNACERAHQPPHFQVWDRGMADTDQPQGGCKKVSLPKNARRDAGFIPFLFFEIIQDRVHLGFQLDIPVHSLPLHPLIIRFVPPKLEPGLIRDSVQPTIYGFQRFVRNPQHIITTVLQ